MITSVDPVSGLLRWYWAIGVWWLNWSGLLKGTAGSPRPRNFRMWSVGGWNRRGWLSGEGVMRRWFLPERLMGAECHYARTDLHIGQQKPLWWIGEIVNRLPDQNVVTSVGKVHLVSYNLFNPGDRRSRPCGDSWSTTGTRSLAFGSAKERMYHRLIT